MSEFHLRDGDRIVFYGDSITEQQLYTVYIEAFVRTRFPNLDALFFNRGWGGDTAWGQTDGGPVELRTERDVAPLKPTVLTAMMGMNDGGYVPYTQTTHQYVAKEYARMVDQLTKAAPNARVTLIRTSPWDQYTTEPQGSYPGDPFPPAAYNDALLEYGKVVEETAREQGFGYVDFNLPMVDVMRRGREQNVELSNQIVPDWIHPGPAGHLIMAGELLKAWDAPRIVCSVALDYASGKILSQENAQVEAFDGLTWTQTDRALPFALLPEDPGIQFVLGLYSFTDSLNQQNLRVQHLESGLYELRIDDQKVGSIGSEKLERGINLAAYHTPMRRQALEVLDLAAKRSMLQMTRWRQVDVKFDLSGSAGEASKALASMEEEVLKQEIAKAQPVARRFSLSRI